MFYACRSLTERKASTFVKKELASKFLDKDYFNKEIYSDGSTGYSHYYMRRPLNIKFNDKDFYIMGIHNYRYRREIVSDCTPVARYEYLVGYHKKEKCDGKWYTYAFHDVKIADSCFSKYQKYIDKEDLKKNKIFAEFYRLHKKETYKNGFLQGDFICYDINGTIIYKTEFNQGTGYYKHFDPEDNSIKEEGMYINGFKDGKWIQYFHSSSERDTTFEVYKNGVKIEPK